MRTGRRALLVALPPALPPRNERRTEMTRRPMTMSWFSARPDDARNGADALCSHLVSTIKISIIGVSAAGGIRIICGERRDPDPSGERRDGRKCARVVVD